MILCQPASSQLKPTYMRTMNQSGASRRSENRNRASGGSAMTVSLWMICVVTLCLLSLGALRGRGRGSIRVAGPDVCDGRDQHREDDAGDHVETVGGRAPVGDRSEDRAAGEGLAREVRAEDGGQCDDDRVVARLPGSEELHGDA